MSQAFAHRGGSDEDGFVAKWAGPFGCPPPELILPALDGVLPDPPLSAVRTHVSGCGLCKELAASLGEAADAPALPELSRIDRRVLAADAPRWRWLSLAAAAAIALTAGGAYLAMSSAEHVEAPPVHSASAPPVARPARESVLALAPPQMELPPELLALRSESRSSYAIALEQALEPFSRGDYATSAARLEHVTRHFPAKPHAQFYLGVSVLLRGDAAPAVRSLERARALTGPGASLYPEATWYLAVALERSGRGAEAVDPLTELCGNGGPRGQQACEGLSRLLNNR